MKLQNETKRYIEMKVAAHYDKLMDPLRTAQQVERDKVKALKEKIESYVMREFEAHGIKISQGYIELGRYGNAATEEYNKLSEEITRLIHQRDLDVQEVFVAMELGGTKADLDELLAKFN